MSFENSFTINSKIDAIRLVRAFTSLNLRDAKVIVENWGVAFGLNESEGWKCSDLKTICKLGSIAKMVDAGTWTIDSTERIIMTKAMTTRDIQELYP
jgi:hypothetical protein